MIRPRTLIGAVAIAVAPAQLALADVIPGTDCADVLAGTPGPDTIGCAQERASHLVFELRRVLPNRTAAYVVPKYRIRSVAPPGASVARPWRAPPTRARRSFVADCESAPGAFLRNARISRGLDAGRRCVVRRRCSSSSRTVIDGAPDGWLPFGSPSRRAPGRRRHARCRRDQRCVIAPARLPRRSAAAPSPASARSTWSRTLACGVVAEDSELVL